MLIRLSDFQRIADWDTREEKKKKKRYMIILGKEVISQEHEVGV